MPQLSRIIGRREFRVELILKLGITLAELSVELGLIAERGEVEGLARREDDGLFREVTIVGVV